MFNGLLDASFWKYVAYYVIFAHITCISITVFLHRAQAHKSLTLHPVLSHFFRFWLWLTTGMVTKEWVAIHRKHHATTETKDDPHSPITHGIRTVLLQGSELYRAEAKNQETLRRFGQGTPDDWIEKHIYSKTALGVTILLILNFILFGIPGITLWAFQMLWTPIFAAGIINGVGHYWGYRNSETPDTSRNILPWGLWIGGEELHNNHHAYPNSAKFSLKPWEFDIGWLYIKLFSALRLLKINTIAPQLSWSEQHKTISSETLKAVLSSRFQILKNYGKEVVAPVFKQEKASLMKKYQGLLSLSKLKQTILQNEAIVDNQLKERVQQILEQTDALKTVYQFKQKLQLIWQSSKTSPKELLEDLQDWCRQAEASGIKALQDFADTLRGYAIQTAH